MSDKPAITIFGAGAVGSALQDFFESEGYVIRSVWNRNSAFLSDDLTGTLKPYASSFPEKENEIGNWIIISTPDDQVSAVSDKLSHLPVDWSSRMVFHCSGSLSSGECKTLAAKGAVTASLHPVQTFRTGDRKSVFRDIYVSIEGDRRAKEILVSVVEKMGARPILLSKHQKQTMHIAAVFASNYLVALMSAAERLLEEDNIENGIDILQPLIRQTVDNVFTKSVTESLTGPIARGDSKTVQSHVSRLSPEAANLYKALGREALAITKSGGRISDKQIGLLENLLTAGESK